MKNNFRLLIPLFVFSLLMISFCVNSSFAQETVTEPPVPVYVFYPDSLKAAFESPSPAGGLSLSIALKKYDTLQFQMQRSSAENTAHFTWLYALIALLGTMNVVLLFITSRIRKELAQIKRFEHQQKLAPVEPPAVSLLPLENKETISSKSSPEAHKPVRVRKKTTKRPRK